MDGEHPGAFGTAAEMDTGHIAQSSIQWAHHCPALCRQGRPNFLGQLSSCQLPTPFQHGGGGRHPTVGTKREPRYAPTRAVWSSLHGSKAGPSGLHWRRTQLQDMVHPAPHTKTKERGDPGSRPGKGKTKQGRGTKDQPKPRQFSSPGTGLGLCCAQGVDISALDSCPPPRCAAHPFRMAAVLDDHAAPFAMSSMRLSAAASGFRRISSQMAFETWPVWVVWLNLNRGTFWSTTETSRSGAEGSTRR